MEKVFLNNKLVDACDAKVSISDSGFLYGMGLFETMRAVEGKVFALDDHLDRLFASAEKLSIFNPHSREFIGDAIGQVLEANELEDARIRLTLTSGPMNVGADEEPEPTLVITATDFAPYPAEFYDKGVKVIISDYRQNPLDPATGHKTINFFSRLMVLKDAHKKQAAEAVWFTNDNLVAEGCVSNVFIVKDGKVFTPKTSTPVMPGIARKHVLGLAKAEGIDAQEKDLTINDLLGADEIFVTNVIMKVLPVIAVEAHDVGEGKPGEVTKTLLDMFNKQLGSV
ncbi:D-alanine aminotransferase [Anaerohalosphaera lusitana]|uniref:branched-chain-amino-acid transaminase n=1 Tax=Anaerohalosphaera lusitana TaxID=1936003 RepID=A0A1U9NJ33_9BACT|nr:aminotransferase class IV [Anaerohalosphaera lusitana]AQT67748.1 D-alanine aminotransferase [Anaerohalosphaera lusitana]